MSEADFWVSEKEFEGFQALIQAVEAADTDNFYELVRILELDPRKDLIEADLSETDLSNGYLSFADLHGANFSSANLSNADLRGANLQNANLQNANLSNADLRGTNIQNANLQGANLNNIKISNSSRIDPRWEKIMKKSSQSTENQNLGNLDLSIALSQRTLFYTSSLLVLGFLLIIILLLA